LIGAKSLWVPTEVRDKTFVAEDEVIFGVFHALSSSCNIDILWCNYF